MNLFRNNIAEIGTPTAGSITKASMVITGSVTFYKDGTWGVAYKASTGTTWSYKTSESQDMEVTISTLKANTKYDIKLFVKFDGVYQYGPAIEATTLES